MARQWTSTVLRRGRSVPGITLGLSGSSGQPEPDQTDGGSAALLPDGLQTTHHSTGPWPLDGSRHLRCPRVGEGDPRLADLRHRGIPQFRWLGAGGPSAASSTTRSTTGLPGRPTTRGSPSSPPPSAPVGAKACGRSHDRSRRGRRRGVPGPVRGRASAPGPPLGPVGIAAVARCPEAGTGDPVEERPECALVLDEPGPGRRAPAGAQGTGRHSVVPLHGRGVATTGLPRRWLFSRRWAWSRARLCHCSP
jgi:hypothetical protein